MVHISTYNSLVNHTPYVILPQKNDVRGVVYETNFYLAAAGAPVERLLAVAGPAYPAGQFSARHYSSFLIFLINSTGAFLEYCNLTCAIAQPINDISLSHGATKVPSLLLYGQ